MLRVLPESIGSIPFCNDRKRVKFVGVVGKKSKNHSSKINECRYVYIKEAVP